MLYEPGDSLVNSKEKEQLELLPGGVVMIRPDLENILDVPIPVGYALWPMVHTDSQTWTDIQRDAEKLMVIEDTLFDNQFGREPKEIRQRCFILRDSRGTGIGTISAWYSRNFRGEEWGRIHWVAIRPDWQGKGLGNVLLSQALMLLRRWHEKAYLVTDNRRLAAIAMYLKFGFIPDMNQPYAKESWSKFLHVYNHPTIRAVLSS
jgi:GNAT superfamily N-acetyltransferase